MKQRLCLGRALIHNPKVLILDEPAAGLDPRARIELREMIGQLADEGRAMLVSSHILTELAEMCDRVGIIEHGGLLAVGTVDEILQDQAAESEDQQARIAVTVISDVESAKRWINDHDGIELGGVSHRTIEVKCSVKPEEQADLLKAMVDSGIRITGFIGKQKSLEDVFLSVTKGRVQ